MDITKEQIEKYILCRDIFHYIENVSDINLTDNQKNILKILCEKRREFIEFETPEEKELLLSLFVAHFLIYNDYKQMVFYSKNLKKSLLLKTKNLIVENKEKIFSRLTQNLKLYIELDNFSSFSIRRADNYGYSGNIIFIENENIKKCQLDELLHDIVPVIESSKEGKLFIIKTKI